MERFMGDASRGEVDHEALLAVLGRIATALEQIAASSARGKAFVEPAEIAAEEPVRSHDPAAALREKLDAARAAKDAERVLELHAAAEELFELDAKRALDREVAAWFLALIQQRLRSGTLNGEVVELAARVSTRFETTYEGASLRAALPTLRRGAGLCPKCGAPYKGLADACPACTAAATKPV